MSNPPGITLPTQGDYIEQLSIDCVIFGYRNRKLHVLVPKLNFKQECYTLPGGFIRQEEGIDAAAFRILEARTGIRKIYLEQFRVFGDVRRSEGTFMQDLIQENVLPSGRNSAELEWLTRRFISIGYYALVDMRKVVPIKNAIDISIGWHPVQELPDMILDHEEIVTEALKTLRLNLDQKLLGFNLLAEKFTMREVRELYEAVYNRPFTRGNFQKKMLDLGVLERLEKKFTGAANKAPYLYRFVP